MSFDFVIIYSIVLIVVLTIYYFIIKGAVASAMSVTNAHLERVIKIMAYKLKQDGVAKETIDELLH